MSRIAYIHSRQILDSRGNPTVEVDVILEPGRKRNVPTAPKFLYRFGNVGIVEVFNEIEAHHMAQTDRHIGVAAEVKIDLQRVGDRAQPAGGG